VVAVVAVAVAVVAAAAAAAAASEAVAGHRTQMCEVGASKSIAALRLLRPIHV
jgi:hypothetical protein